jgi:hypothetical protein
MRVTQPHRNWVALGEGQELKCNGCHDANSGLSHGRYDAFASAYAGAPAGVTEFPNTDPQWFIGEPGETMAEIRARVTCANDGCSSLEPSMNAIYTDVWSANPLDANGDPINPDIRYQYAGLNTPSPTTLACESDWQWNCRSVINYETIIHPLWGLDRPQFDDAGNPIVDGNGVPVDMRCTSCHAFPYIDPADGVTVLPPAGQLELTDGPSIDEPDHLHAYRELLVTDNLQEVDANGVLVDVIEIAQDADGNDIIITFPVAPPASEAGARASSDFFDRFISPNHPGYGIHGGIMSGAELRLVAEWLDVGAQYFNNPFDAPAN